MDPIVILIAAMVLLAVFSLVIGLGRSHDRKGWGIDWRHSGRTSGLRQTQKRIALAFGSDPIATSPS